MVQSTLNSPTAHKSLSCAKRAMHTFDFLDSICRNSENESPITLLLLRRKLQSNLIQNKFAYFTYIFIPTSLDIWAKVAWEAHAFISKSTSKSTSPLAFREEREEIGFFGSKKAFGFRFAGQRF